MLRQLLAKAEIPRLKEWEETLLKLSLRVASYLALNPRAPGASMDVRSYVKIKKIPGGNPRDSEYVDGAVITKNVAHKNMVRDIRNPRIMLVSFPFDYHRVEGQFMPFDPLLAQERDYLYNLVSRVSALRPHVVLVEKSVSRLALDYLLKANIAVARTVKNPAIQFVARATQAQILTSMDRLVMEPQMGHCARFRLQTFEHPLIPGLRKTYMRFEGCSPDTACTIVLRGEDIDTLKRIKAVTSFIMFIVRNLKMETFLWKDTIISMPPMTTEAAPPSYCELNLRMEDIPDVSLDIVNKTSSEANIGTMAEPTRRELSRRIQDSIKPYLANFISASATLRFPPPYALWRMKELDDRVKGLQKEWEDAETAAILEEETGQRSLLQQPSLGAGYSTTEASDVEDGPNTPLARVVTLPTEAVDPVPNQNRGLPHSVSYSSLASRAFVMKPISPSAESFEPPTAPRIRLFSEIARESALHQARFEYAEQLRIWEWYLRKNADDFVVQKYQCIHVRYFAIPTLAMELEPSCHMPKLTRISYYGENDCTLGQFIEDTIVEALDSRRLCEGKGCRRPLGAHSKVYVHHESRVVIAAEPWIPASSSEASALTPDKIASFSVCRVCLQTTPFIPLSDEALKYSFGKFLELHFYPADVQLIHGAGCEHNIYLHHIRYFASHGMTVRFQTDAVDIHEVVLPPMRTVVHMEPSLELKNRDYESLLARNTSYWQSVINRITQLQLQVKPVSPQDESGAAAAEVAGDLLQRVEADRAEIARTIQQTYTHSLPTDTLALGAVRSLIQNKVVDWDLKLEQFEKTYTTPRTRLISEKDFRRMTGSHHFKRIYDDFFGQYASSASEVDEKSDTRPDEPESSVYSEPESMDEKKSPPVYSGDQPTIAELLGAPLSASSGGDDSDSTISAHVRPLSASEVCNGEPVNRAQCDSATPAAAPLDQPLTESRLPRWQGYPKMSVAELVKQFQSTTGHGFERAASGDEAICGSETITPLEARRRTKSSSKPRPSRDSATSDFERSYAANIGPKHLTTRHSSGRAVGSTVRSRIPAPRHRFGHSHGYADTGVRPAYHLFGGSTKHVLPNEEFPEQEDAGGAPLAKGKTPVKHARRFPPRPVYHKSIVRPISSSSKVSNLARQFERMSKDSERASRRYAVLKGRKARPVAVAHAKVKAFSDIKDMRGVVLDGSDDSSDSLSEADDEDDSDEDTGHLESSDPSVSQPSASPTQDAPPAERSSSQDHSASVDITPATPEQLLQELPESPSSGNHIENAGTLSTNNTNAALPGRPAADGQSTLYSDIGSSAESTSSMISTVSAWWRSAQGAVPLQYPL